MAQGKRSRALDFLLIFLLVYVLSQAAFRFFFPKPSETLPPQGILTLRAQDPTIRGGHEPILLINNSTAAPVTLESRCPGAPVDLVLLTTGETPLSEPKILTPTQETAVLCPGPVTIASGEESELSLAPWKYSLLSEYGTYEARLPSGSGALTGTGTSARFTIYEPGVVVKVFRTFITKPFLNFLIFMAGVLPNHSLGIGIIVLTILVKLLLFLPTQKSLEGQRKMQMLQPKLQELRVKHKDDPTRMQQETVRLWKEHKVNPFQACGPVLWQFPILIGLFFVIRDGSSLELSHHLIYPTYQDLTWTFNHSFLGLDLTQPSILFVPLLAILQYIQMRLAFHFSGKKRKQADAPQSTADKLKDEGYQQELQQKIMLYAFPLMIGFFAIQFPAAVSLYWAVSTLFAIGQQVIVNREKLVP